MPWEKKKFCIWWQIIYHSNSCCGCSKSLLPSDVFAIWAEGSAPCVHRNKNGQALHAQAPLAPPFFLLPLVRCPLPGKFPGSVEEMLAFVSYLPLCGDGGSRGDGIIPLDVATLAGSTVVELPASKHSGTCCRARVRRSSCSFFGKYGWGGRQIQHHDRLPASPSRPSG